MELNHIQEQFFFSTVRIVTEEKNSDKISIGTGFIISVPVKGEEHKVGLYLVSNRHVLKNPDDRLKITFHRGNKGRLKLGNFVNIQNDSFNQVYIDHIDPKVDLACLNITNLVYNDPEIFYKSMRYDMLSDFSETDLLPGASVWFVGYPENRYDISHNLPILRKGSIASIPKIDYNSRKEFVIDAQVFPGSSGSPLLTKIIPECRILGVISQTMIRHGKLQTVPTDSTLGVEQPLGLGIVIKSTQIREMLDHAIENKIGFIE